MANRQPRLESGPRVGLVLGAGGARGFAHIGALKVIEQHRVRIDLVVGASMGSLIGACYAAGMAPAAMEAAIKEVRFRPLFRPRLTRRGLVDPSGVHDVIRRILGDRRFEDLDHELAVLTASLTTGRSLVLREGRVADAVLASIAIPLLFPPVLRGEDCLMDGGMIEGLPVRYARQLGAEIVVAVDADNHARRVWCAPGLRQLTSRLARALSARAPVGPADGRLILARVLHHIVERTAVETPDLLIQPKFGRMTSFHYHRWARCIELGEAAAAASLTELLALSVAPVIPAPVCEATEVCEATPTWPLEYGVPEAPAIGASLAGAAATLG